MIMSCYQHKQNVSILLVLSLMISIWFTVAPLGSANASILGSIGNAAKSIFVNVGALAAGAVTGVVGMAVGGGPLGMAVGGLGGYIVGKKVLNWTTASVGNFATVAGAIGGGLLCAGMGFPMLAIGVVGGGLLAKTVTKGVSALFGKNKGKSFTIAKKDIDQSAAAQEAKEIEAYLAASLNNYDKNKKAEATSNNVVLETNTGSSSGAPVSSQQAYELYTAAYKEYTSAAQAGDRARAEKSLESYRTYFKIYSDLLDQGR
jgi:hypothetical protein